MIKPMRYPEIYQSEQADPPFLTMRTVFADTIDRSVAEMILNYLPASTAMIAAAQLRVLGGAMARVPADATAFAHRQSRIMGGLVALYKKAEERPAHEIWATDFAAALRQGDGGAYVNFLADEGEGRVRAAYPGKTWERLTQIKARYDPTNLFHLNQNIPPATK